VKILLYVTEDRARHLGGEPLAICMQDGDARQELLFTLAKELKASVMRLTNGDHIVVREA
jgi:hypothetical protein